MNSSENMVDVDDDQYEAKMKNIISYIEHVLLFHKDSGRSVDVLGHSLKLEPK